MNNTATPANFPTNPQLGDKFTPDKPANPQPGDTWTTWTFCETLTGSTWNPQSGHKSTFTTGWKASKSRQTC